MDKNLFEESFYFLLSVRAFIPSDAKGTKKVLERMHSDIETGEKTPLDYSPVVYSAYKKYLQFLGLIEKYD